MHIVHTANKATDMMEALMEIYENDNVYCQCPHCHQTESLSFIGNRLASGTRRWKQLKDGRLIHLCEMTFTSIDKSSG